MSQQSKLPSRDANQIFLANTPCSRRQLNHSETRIAAENQSAKDNWENKRRLNHIQPGLVHGNPGQEERNHRHTPPLSTFRQIHSTVSTDCSPAASPLQWWRWRNLHLITSANIREKIWSWESEAAFTRLSPTHQARLWSPAGAHRPLRCQCDNTDKFSEQRINTT